VVSPGQSAWPGARVALRLEPIRTPPPRVKGPVEMALVEMVLEEMELEMISGDQFERRRNRRRVAELRQPMVCARKAEAVCRCTQDTQEGPDAAVVPGPARDRLPSPRRGERGRG
jgi:hypothetical protein